MLNLNQNQLILNTCKNFSSCLPLKFTFRGVNNELLQVFLINSLPENEPQDEILGQTLRQAKMNF